MMTLRQCRSRAGVLGNLMSEASGRRRGHLTVHGKSKGTSFCNFLVTNSKSTVYTLVLRTPANLCLQDCQVDGILPFGAASNKARTHLNLREGFKRYVAERTGVPPVSKTCFSAR